MPRFTYPHDKIVDYLSLGLSLFMLWVVYQLGSSLVHVMKNNKQNPIYSCGLAEACRANGGDFIQAKTTDVYSFTCKVRRAKDITEATSK